MNHSLCIFHVQKSPHRFNRINENAENGNKEGNKEGNKKLNTTQIKILAEIRNNPNITKKQLTIEVSVGKTAKDNGIQKLKRLGYIEREGSNKTGYWRINNSMEVL